MIVTACGRSTAKQPGPDARVGPSGDDALDDLPFPLASAPPIARARARRTAGARSAGGSSSTSARQLRRRFPTGRLYLVFDNFGGCGALQCCDTHT